MKSSQFSGGTDSEDPEQSGLGGGHIRHCGSSEEPGPAYRVREGFLKAETNQEEARRVFQMAIWTKAKRRGGSPMKACFSSLTVYMNPLAP